MYPEGLSPSETFFSVGYLPKMRMYLLCASKSSPLIKIMV